MFPDLPRRTLLGLAAAAAVASRGSARTIIPDEGIDILVGFQSTGGPDVVARRIASELERRIGRRIGVENRPGDAGARPGATLLRQPADGTVLALFASSTFIAQLAEPESKFDPIADLAPICLVGTWPVALAVSPRIGVATFEEYRRWLKSDDPARHKIGSVTPDAFTESFNRIFSRELGVAVQGVVSPGPGALVNDLESGRVPAGVSGIVSLLEHHRGGRLRLLLTTGPERLAVARDVPTTRELGMPNLEMDQWYGFFARAGTPQPLIDEWNRQIAAILADPLVAGELAQMGLTLSPSTPQQLGELLARHIAAWKTRLVSVGITPVR
ncbi:MAG TPA: tripartite tricarboxylate transporter substrate-binding protein [Reyranella sp.]|jgi:tripartite-type tricarboxylate transporter receptor subunit TctC